MRKPKDIYNDDDFKERLYSDKIWNVSETGTFLSTLTPSRLPKSVNRGNKKTGKEPIEYYNIPCAFDTETTSINIDGAKYAHMYIWQFGIFGSVIVGRTWEEFSTFLGRLVDHLELNLYNRLVIYIHNMAFDFQFFRKWLTWNKNEKTGYDEIFAIKSRTPVRAVSCDGFEFRCSYIQSNKSLKTIGEELNTFKGINKLKGQLDYTKNRHYETPLTKEEMEYCVNDIRVLLAYIMECIHKDGNITKLKLTSTGYVRDFVKKKCLYPRTQDGSQVDGRAAKKYRKLMEKLTVTKDSFKRSERAFQGGFTHSSNVYSCELLEDVTSYDITSSYPTVMVSEMYPMSKAMPRKPKSREQIDKYCKMYCCIMDIEFLNLREKEDHSFEHPLSYARCTFKKRTDGKIEFLGSSKDVIVENGRIVSTPKDFITCTTITNVDLQIIETYYEHDGIRVTNMDCYQKAYLPKPIIDSVLEFYKLKTELKGVANMEILYSIYKAYLNSIYGMMVTNPLNADIPYDGEWLDIIPPDEDAQIDQYNNSMSRFLYYPWGVFITAYARKNIFYLIGECGVNSKYHQETGNYGFPDYVYTDTDSVKMLNAKYHMGFIEKYNKMIIKKIRNCLTFYNIDISMASPKNKKGEEKPLGVFDFDGHYKYFMTTGAKRYMYIYDNGHMDFTISGVRSYTDEEEKADEERSGALPYLINKYGGKMEVFKAFALTEVDHEMLIPGEHSGKLCHTYIDDELNYNFTDYQGKTVKINERSSCCLTPQPFGINKNSNTIEEYVDFLMTRRS